MNLVQTSSFAFSALVSTFNAHGQPLELPESLIGMMLMSDAQIDDTHCVTIVSSWGAGTKITSATKNDTVIAKIQY